MGDQSVNSQLVYGLYPEKLISLETQLLEETGNLDEATELSCLIEAHQNISEQPTLLLLPQDIALERSFPRSSQSLER